MKKTLIIMVLLLFCLALLAENLPRPYPIPRPINPPTRMEEGLKGPVKTVISESGEFPYYYVESEYSADGLLLHGTVGRINFTANVSYSYNSMGFLTKIEATEFTGGQDYPCLLYTSDAADDPLCVDLGGRRIIKNNNTQHIPHVRSFAVVHSHLPHHHASRCPVRE